MKRGAAGWWLLVMAALSGCGRSELEVAADAVVGLGGRTPGSAGASGMQDGVGGRAGNGGVPGSAGAGSPNSGQAGSPTNECIVYVAQATGDDSNSGAGWSHALWTVGRGLDVAAVSRNSGTCTNVEVWVAAGEYLPHSVLDASDIRSTTFELVPMVALYGGFAGTEMARAERDVHANLTVLSGDVDTRGDNADNAYHVVTGATGATLDGFTISDGNANGSSLRNGFGGGLFNEYASPSVANCIFSGNSATNGGAIYNLDASPAVTNCTFTGNSASPGDGGAIFSDGSSPVVSNSSFSDNYAQRNGGAVSNENASTPELTNCTFNGDSASGYGGAIENQNSSPTVTNCTFSQNAAYMAGAMDNDASLAVVENSTFSDNSAYVGGAMINRLAPSRVTNCTFARNHATTMAGPTAEAGAWGGAMYNQDASPVVTSCTFSGNRGDQGGGAIYNSGSLVTVTDSILWGDRLETVTNEIDDADSSYSTVSYSIVQGGYSGNHVVSSDPHFVDAASGNFQLSADSPAIDAGNGCANYVTLEDQAGNVRWNIQSVPDVADGFDIGAFEYQGVAGLDRVITQAVCQ